MPYLRYIGQKALKGYRALPLIPPPTPVAPTYTIANSLRLRSNIGSFLTRTPAVAGNLQTWTWSGWVKRGTAGGGGLLIAYSSLGNGFQFKFLNDQLTAFSENSNTTAWSITTAAVYRDFAAWYHIVLSYDTTQAIASNRVRLYVNGIQVTAFATATYPAQNYQDYVNRQVAHNMGVRVVGIDNFFDGYFSEINFVEGQALAATAFGVQNDLVGWEPIGYTGTYGALGYFLNMQGVRVVGGTIMSLFAQAFLNSGTFTIPIGTNAIKVTLIGGGGGGGSTPNDTGSFAGGGGAGAVGIQWFSGLTPGNTLSVTVGTGGGSNAAGATTSISSGTQTITTTSVSGGSPGLIPGGVDQGAAGGAGGSSFANTLLSFSGGAGGNGGGNSASGGGGAAGGGPGINSIGGGGAWGQGAAGVSSRVNGNNAVGFGNGGSGAGSDNGGGARSGGSGSGGLVLIEW